MYPAVTCKGNHNAAATRLRFCSPHKAYYYLGIFEDHGHQIVGDEANHFDDILQKAYKSIKAFISLILFEVAAVQNSLQVAPFPVFQTHVAFVLKGLVGREEGSVIQP